MIVKKKIQRRQNKLLKSLSKVGPFIEGTLTIVNRICGTESCQCRKDPTKKHPAMFLTWKENKKSKALYIPVSMQKDAIAWNKNYKKLKKQIKKASDFHKKLLKAR